MRAAPFLLSLAVAMIIATAAGPRGGGRSVSSRLPVDTLTNGLPRDVAAKLRPVARLWRYGLPRYALDSLVRGGRSVVRPDFAWGGKDARDIGDRNLDVWSPDSTRWPNHDFYIGAGEEDGSVEFGGDVDSAPVLGDVKPDSVWRLDFCGTPCAFDGAWWIDTSRFVLIGNEAKEGSSRADVDSGRDELMAREGRGS